MKNYYRVMLGRKSKFAQECFAEGFIGTDFLVQQDLSGKLPDQWREFNHKFIPIYLSNHPGKTKVAAGLACGALWTVSKGILKGDIVLCPDGEGHYYIGEVVGEYNYKSGAILPHRRPMKWFDQTIERSSMSEALKNSTGSAGTVSKVSGHAQEIEKLIGNISAPRLLHTDETVEDPSEFAMEEHLEDFLVNNWKNTELGKAFDVYEEDGEKVGQQYLVDTGKIDIFAISKDKKTLLVIELKRGRASDVVVGQTLRYMGYVKEELAEDNQDVRGIIIALEDDQKIRRALSMTPNISFYRYEVSFKLVKS